MPRSRELSAWMMEHTLEDQGYFRTVEPLMRA